MTSSAFQQISGTDHFESQRADIGLSTFKSDANPIQNEPKKPNNNKEDEDYPF